MEEMNNKKENHKKNERNKITSGSLICNILVFARGFCVVVLPMLKDFFFLFVVRERKQQIKLQTLKINECSLFLNIFDIKES